MNFEFKLENTEKSHVTFTCEFDRVIFNDNKQIFNR